MSKARSTLVGHLARATVLFHIACLLGACSVPTPEIAAPSLAATPTCEATAPQQSLAFDPLTIANLEGIVRKFVDAGIAPGAVLKIEQRGKTVVDFAYGKASRESGRPMSGDAYFRLYSMTKPVTSVATMRLIERGLLDLDDPVFLYIPEFADAYVFTSDGLSTEPLERPITIRDLLTHTAGISYRTNQDSVGKLYAKKGIPAGPGVADPPTDGSAPVETLQELVDRVANTPLRSQPGQAWTYGNATDVLGRVLEVAIDKPLSTILREEVLDPVGMSETAFFVTPDRASRLTAAYLNPAPKLAGSGVLASTDLASISEPLLVLVDPADVSIFTKYPTIAYGGSGLIGTASDYLRFTRMLRSGGDIDGMRVLKKSTVETMIRNQIATEARSASATLGELGFGFGLAVKESRGEMAPQFPVCGYFWGGAASTFFWVDPVDEVSGVLMTQVFGGDTSSFWLAIMEELYAN